MWAGSALATPPLWASEWPDTDFQVTSVESWDEVLSGGPPKDGIPALTEPKFVPVSQVTFPEGEPLIIVEVEGQVPRAYPLRYLMWHEIVNDRIGYRFLAITYCPLCNSALTFDRVVGGNVLEFGVSGKLRHSDMVMYDRQSESWWQQAIGEAIVGEMTGTSLESFPSWMESMAEYKSRNPDGLIMAEPAFARSYGRNPYIGYDSLQRPFLYDGTSPPHNIPALSRVVRIGERAWPLLRLRKEGEVVENGVVISWSSGQNSVLDTADITKGRDVGSVRVRDLEGRDLPHDVMFAFAFHAFWPEGEWMLEKGM